MYFGNLGTYVSRSGPFGNHPTLRGGLLAYWPLQETTGVRYDIVGLSHLTEYGTVGTDAGKHGNAAVFTGDTTKGLYRLNDTLLAVQSADFTIAYWAFLSSGLTEYHLSHRDLTAGTLNFNIFNGPGGPTDIYLETATGIASGQIDAGWSLVVAGRSGSTLYFYVNNVLGTSGASGASSTTPGTFALGGRTLTNGQPAGAGRFTGLLDEGLLYSRFLTNQERADLWDGGNGLFY